MGEWTIRTKKFITNPLLGRKQMIVEVIHPNMAAVKKDDIRVKLAQQYKASQERIIVFGMKHNFGGGRSSGFALIYDSLEAETSLSRSTVWFALVTERRSRPHVVPRKTQRTSSRRFAARTRRRRKAHPRSELASCVAQCVESFLWDAI